MKGPWKRIMRVCSQDYVDVLDSAGKLVVDSESVVRPEYNDVGSFFTHPLDICPDLTLVDPERPIGNHPGRIGHGSKWVSLPEHGNTYAAFLENSVRFKYEILPLCLANIKASLTI